MSAILRGTARGATLDSGKTSRPGAAFFSSSEFETIFAVCVMLGALWLLVSGYA